MPTMGKRLILLLLSLVVNLTVCELRSRDPEDAEEDQDIGLRLGRSGGMPTQDLGPNLGLGFGRREGGGRGGGLSIHLEKAILHARATQQTPQHAERRGNPTRTGNWCAFEQKRVVTVAVACGIEQYVVRSESPCPSGAPDCQPLVMYKSASRPVYRQKQRVDSAMLWRCCHGHGGQNCEDTLSDAPLDSGSSAVIGRSATGLHRLQNQRVDPNREQNDHQPFDISSSVDPQIHPTHPQHDASYRAYNPPHHPPIPQHDTTHHAFNPSLVDPNPHHTAHTHQQHGQNYEQQPTETGLFQQGNAQEHNTHHTRHPARHHEVNATGSSDHHNVTQSAVQTHRDNHPTTQHDGRTHEPPHFTQDLPDELDSTPPPLTPVPDIMALVMSQLQPMLLGFNRSLETLSQQVGDLARDVAQIKSTNLGSDHLPEPPGRPELDDGVEERLDTKLEEVYEQIGEVRRQMNVQRADTDSRLHTHNAMLHYNLTAFKTDVDMKLKRHHKMLQTSLQAVNSTLSELKLDQDQMNEDRLEDHAPPLSLPAMPTDTSSLWEELDRLDIYLVNNTVKIGGLMEDMDVTSGSVLTLKRDLVLLQKLLNQTARDGQMKFMETGLEVEAAREAVLSRVNEIAGNLTLHHERITEAESDLDYLFNAQYKQNSTHSDCDCKGLKAALIRLERGVANVTELANENRVSLDDISEGGGEMWAGGDWEPAVEALQHGLQQVKEFLSTQTSSTSLEESVAQIGTSMSGVLSDISALKASELKTEKEMHRLNGSFNSLLKDAIRHSDVLELLLGEEVLEFLDWPVPDQEAHSIPALKEQLRMIQGNRDEVPSADQPSSDWLRTGGDVIPPARERQVLTRRESSDPGHGGDGSDLWNLERAVDQLQLKVLRLEEKQLNTTAPSPPSGQEGKLHTELTRLKRGLEDHLRVFKNVFSNADVLEAKHATLELDKVWKLLKNKEGKKDKKKREGEGDRERGRERSKREAETGEGSS